MLSYADFLATKRREWRGAGLEPDALPPQLFDWQAAIVRWALRKGRAAIFGDCGLGKTFMQVAWAHATGRRTIILAPLCVAEQTVAEAAKLGIAVRYAPDHQHIADHPIIVTNYERLEKFDASAFGAVVLDESSILKAFDGATRTKLIETFQQTPFRLCCTATPAPNDISELANHAEFLGLMTRPEFLATWFLRVGEGLRTTEHHGWRMKRHARVPFYRWLSSWAIAMRQPSDLGYANDGFVLPPLEIHDCIVPSDAIEGTLFPELGVKGLSGRLNARRGSLELRVDAATNLVHEWGVPWIVWCGLNLESAALTRAISGAVEVKGSDDYASKVGAVQGFQAGRIHRIVSKSKILGFGLNFQHCSHMAFVGLSDSYESYYQCLRRCWRYGQKKTVHAHIIVSEAEHFVVENVRKKEAKAHELSAELLQHMQPFEREELMA